MNNKSDTQFNLGSNQSGMRAYNERLVLSLVRRHTALAKSDIAKMTGLSAQTISIIMRQLETDGLLKKEAKNRVKGKVGQPSIPMSLNANGALFFGLKIGRKSSSIVLIDFLGQVIHHKQKLYSYPTPKIILDFTLDSIQLISQKLNKKQKQCIAGLGIGIPFQLWKWADSPDSPQDEMKEWRNANIEIQLAQALDFPVYIENDMSSACAAELVFGTATNERDFLYIYIGHFIGGGVVLNGSYYTGPSQNAGAIGSILVPSENNTVTQLINVASLSALKHDINPIEDTNNKDLWEAYNELFVGDKTLNTWIENTAIGIAYAIASSIAVIDFNTIVIDGYLPDSIRSKIIESVRIQLETFNLNGLRRPEIIEGSIGKEARSIGAATLPLSHNFLVEHNS